MYARSWPALISWIAIAPARSDVGYSIQAIATAIGLVALARDARDIAEVAANALMDPMAQAGRMCTLTGPEALSFAKIANTLSDELARIIRYEPASIVGYRGLPATQIMIQTRLHVGLRFGQSRSVTDILAGLLARRPFPVREYVRDHGSLWL